MLIWVMPCFLGKVEGICRGIAVQQFFGRDIFEAFKIWALFKSSFRIKAASLILLHFYWCPNTKFYNWNQKSHKINALCSKLQWTDQYCSTLGIIQTLDTQPTNNSAHWGGFLLIFIGAQQCQKVFLNILATSF